jgi:uncharacterized protein
MRLDPNEQSANIEDRRNQTGGGGGGMRRVGIGGGIGTILIIVLGLIFGFDPSMLLQLGQVAAPAQQQASPQQRSQPGARAPAQDEGARFVSSVMATTEKTWGSLFQEGGARYPEPTLVLFRGSVQSACGAASAATGPFYCPADQKVYIDLQFFQELQNRFRAPGDFAQAYVIAHEVGHHVQNVMGTMQKVDAARRRASKSEANALSVRLELQADCYAGIWAHHTEKSRSFLERGDIEEGLAAATAIGDDRLQKQAQGYVVPDSFTHGSSEQRVRWFKVGLQTGSLKSCDTFATNRL